MKYLSYLLLCLLLTTSLRSEILSPVNDSIDAALPLAVSAIGYCKYEKTSTVGATSYGLLNGFCSPPANDDCADATSMSFAPGNFTATALFATVGATISQAPVATCVTGLNEDVWFTFKAPSSGEYQLFFDQITGNASGAVDFQLFKGGCNRLQSVACEREFRSFNNPFYWSYILKDSAYFIRVWSSNKNQPVQGSLRVISAGFHQNDDCSGAIPFPLLPSDSCTFLPVSTLFATPSVHPDCLHSDDDVWFTLQPSTKGRYLIKIDQYKPLPGFEGSEVMLRIYAGACGNTLTPIWECQYYKDNPYTPELAPGTTYYLRMWTTDAGNRATWKMCISLENKITLSPCATAVALPISPKGACTFTPLPMNAGQVVHCSYLVPYDRWIVVTPNVSGNHILRCKNFNAPAKNWHCGLFKDSCGLWGNVILCDFVYQDAVVLPMQKDVTYFVQIGLNENTPPSWSLCLEAPFGGPVNDDCANAITLQVAADTGCVFRALATHMALPTLLSGSCVKDPANDVWYRFTPATTATYSFIIRNLVYAASYGRIGYQILKGTCGTFSEILCDSSLTDGAQTPVLTGGTTYYLRLWNTQGFSSAWEMCIQSNTLAAKNDLCQNATPITNGSNIWQSLTGTTPDPGAPVCEGITSADKGVWYVYTPGSGDKGLVKIAGCDNPYDMKVLVYTGSCNALACYEGDNDNDCPGGFGAETTAFTPALLRDGSSALELDEKYYILISCPGSTLRFTVRAGTSAAPESAKEMFASPVVAPNPSIGTITVRWHSPRACHLAVRFFNDLGQVVLQQSLSATAGDNVFSFDLSALPAGLYRVQLVYEAWCSRAMMVQKI